MNLVLDAADPCALLVSLDPSAGLGPYVLTLGKRPLLEAVQQEIGRGVAAGGAVEMRWLFGASGAFVPGGVMVPARAIQSTRVIGVNLVPPKVEEAARAKGKGAECETCDQCGLCKTCDPGKVDGQHWCTAEARRWDRRRPLTTEAASAPAALQPAPIPTSPEATVADLVTIHIAAVPASPAAEAGAVVPPVFNVALHVPEGPAPNVNVPVTVNVPPAAPLTVKRDKHGRIASLEPEEGA